MFPIVQLTIVFFLDSVDSNQWTLSMDCWIKWRVGMVSMSIDYSKWFPFIYCWTVGYLKCMDSAPFLLGNATSSHKNAVDIMWHRIFWFILRHLKLLVQKKLLRVLPCPKHSRCPRVIRGFTKISSFNDRNFTPQKMQTATKTWSQKWVGKT